VTLEERIDRIIHTGEIELTGGAYKGKFLFNNSAKTKKAFGRKNKVFQKIRYQSFKVSNGYFSLARRTSSINGCKSSEDFECKAGHGEKIHKKSCGQWLFIEKRKHQRCLV